LIERFQCILSQNGFDLGQSIAGLSGGIPAQPFVHGSIHGGVAVATSFLQGQADVLAAVLAHETGHWLGLFHAQENLSLGGDPIYDNISDTPNNADSVHNLMYFSVHKDATLTAGQGVAVRNNPRVQP
jgi:hypothetical protein